MEQFKIEIGGIIYAISRLDPSLEAFLVTNQSSASRIGRNSEGKWILIESRLGSSPLPLDQLGELIEQHYQS